MKPLFNNVAIVGVGLIGGSLGMSIIGRGLAGEVTGIDSSAKTLEIAMETKAITRACLDIISGVKEADLVVIATPVGISADILGKILPHIKPGTIITDVGSTKRSIVSKAEELMPANNIFVGGHPMAGSEQSGIIGADRYLFENAIYIITPTPNTDRETLVKIRTLVSSLGARIIELDPATHDLMVAGVSHLPHLMATALVNTVGNIQQQYDKTLLLAAGGFRDTTRIASSQPIMWRDIFLTNREMILKVLAEFRGVLDEFEKEIQGQSGEKLTAQFSRARELRASIPEKVRGYLPLLHEIVVTVPDKPGMIAEIASILGSKGINISDIEILRVREGEGGTIRLGFNSEFNQEEAISALMEQGIVAKVRK